MNATIPATGYYLENRIGGHRKFYTVILAEDVVAVAWGRIGTAGQNKIQKFQRAEDAQALGLRQMYAKQTRGYSVLASEFKFTIDASAIEGACERGSAQPLLAAFAEARRNPEYQGDKQVVMKHYDDFVTKAQRLLNTAGDRAFDEVYAEFEELEQAWTAISDKHDEAAVTIDLAKQTLAQRLMSGAL